jgi:outer membrane protein TolC
MITQIRYKFCWLALLVVPCLSTADVLTIDDAIALAIKNSAEIKVSEADLNAQSNKNVSSWLELGPRLTLNYDHIFYEKKLFLPSSEILLRDDITKTGNIILTQPITPLIALFQKARMENKQKNIKESAHKLSKAQSAFKIAELYLRAQQSEQMWEIARSSVQYSIAQKKDGEAMQRAERIHQGDLLKLELALSQASLNEAKERAAKDMAFFSLKEFIGYKSDHELVLDKLGAVKDDVFANLPSLEEALSTALAHRQELKQAMLGSEAAHIGKTASWARFFPNINFFAKIDHNFGVATSQQPKNNKMLGFNMSWDFFNSGAHFFEARAASFNAIKTLYQADILKHAIRIEVMQALSSLKALREGLVLAEKAVEQANESYRIEKLQFSSGKTTASQLILAETAKFKADGSLISVLSDLKIQKLKLQQALGELRPEL